MKHIFFCLLLIVSRFCFAEASFESLTLCEDVKVGVTTLESFDYDRNRPVIIEIWYPIDQREYAERICEAAWVFPLEARDAAILSNHELYPLIVMSHGNGGDRRDRTWLVEKLVPKSYIVASVDHYGDTWDYKDPEHFLRPWNRALDVSFVIDRLLADPFLGRHINAKQIGFAGYSLGGMTGIWLAGGISTEYERLLKLYQRFKGEYPDEVVYGIDFDESRLSYLDPRIQAYYLMSPPTWGFSRNSLKSIECPCCIVSGEKDDIVTVSSHAKRLAYYVPDSELKILEGKIGHFIFLNCPTEFAKSHIEERMIIDHLSVDRAKVHNEAAEHAVEFFQKKLRTSELAAE